MTMRYYLVSWIERDVILPGVGMVERTHHKQILPAISSAQAQNIVRSGVSTAEDVSAVLVGTYQTKTANEPT